MEQRVIITGGLGQLGWELQRTNPPRWKSWITDLEELDITDRASVAQAFRDFRPHLVINAAAYKAEEEEEAAFLVNQDGISHIAETARLHGTSVIHISTDFVFDGASGIPYRPTDTPNPLSVYGKSKRAGEEALFRLHPQGAIVVRTAWLYSSHGHNFVKTMLTLFDQRRPPHHHATPIRVVNDQIGTPTWAFHLAQFLWFLADRREMIASPCCYHFTNEGVASWYDVAVAVEEETRSWRGYQTEIVPIPSTAYPTKAKRPPFSVLNKEETWRLWGRASTHWREALRMMLTELAPGGVTPRME